MKSHVRCTRLSDSALVFKVKDALKFSVRILRLLGSCTMVVNFSFTTSWLAVV